MTAAALWAALLLQADAILEKAEAASREGGDFTARVTAEVEDKGNESRTLASGTLSFGAADRTLQVDLREARPGSKLQKTSLRDGGAFHPFELWRRGAGRWLHDLFEVGPAGGAEELPPGVSGPDGIPIPPRRAKPQARRRAYDRSAPEGPEGETGGVVLDLVPRDETLRRRFLSLRIHLDPETSRVLRMAVDTPRQKTTYALHDVREAGR
jgi:hypothetical protein